MNALASAQAASSSEPQTTSTEDVHDAERYQSPADYLDACDAKNEPALEGVRRAIQMQLGQVAV